MTADRPRTVVIHLDGDTGLPDRDDDPTGYLLVLVEQLLARTYEANQAHHRGFASLTKELHRMAVDEATFKADLKKYFEAVDTVIAAQQSASAKASAAGIDLTAEDEQVKAAQAKIAGLNLTPPSAPAGASGGTAPAGAPSATTGQSGASAGTVAPPTAGTPVVAAGTAVPGSLVLPVTAAPVAASSLPPETPVVAHPVAAGSTTTTAGMVTGETPVMVVPVETAPVAASTVDPTTPVVVAPAAPAADEPTKALYLHPAGPVPDAEKAMWPLADEETTDVPPQPLYTFVNDAPGQPPTGAGPEWVPFTGAVQPRSAS